MSAPDTKIHIGRKIKRIREIKGLKQEALASMLGETQQAVSKLEQAEDIDDDKLKKIADALDMSVDAIRNFNEEAIIYNIQNNYDGAVNNINYQNHPVDKIVELYERLLQAEREKIAMLEKHLNNR